MALASGGTLVSELRDAFDVCVTSDDALGQVVDVVTRRPIASLALVQLLRRSVRRSVHEALVDESLVYSVLQSGPEVGPEPAEVTSGDEPST